MHPSLTRPLLIIALCSAATLQARSGFVFQNDQKNDRKKQDSLVATRVAGKVAAKDTVRADNEREIVVTASVAPTDVSASLHRTRIINATRFRDQQAATVRDVFATVVGIRLSQDNVLGSGMTLQGLGGQNVKILVNGVPVVGRVNNTVDISQLPLANAEKIEIVEGPMSVMYGSDALGGVVNIITKTNVVSPIKLEMRSYGESAGTLNADGALEGNVEGVSWRLSGGRNFFGGWSPDTLNYKRAEQWKPREQYFTDLTLRKAISTVDVTLESRYFRDHILNRGEPRAPYGEIALDDSYITTRLTQVAKASIPFGEGDVLSLMGSYSYYERNKLSTIKDLVTLQATPLEGAGAQDTTLLNTTLLRVFTKFTALTDVTVSGGVDANLESTKSGRLADGGADMQDVGAFAEVAYSITPALTLQPSARVSWNSAYGILPSPAFHALYKPANDIRLRASYARGYRAPSLRELYMYFVDINHDIVGNGNLKTEQSHAINASATWLPDIEDNAAYSFEVSGFYNDVTNLITLAQGTGTQYTYVNLGKSLSTGSSVTISRNTNALNVSLAGQLMARKIQPDALDATFDAPVNLNFEATSTINWHEPLLDGKLNLFFKWTGAMPTTIIDETGGVIVGTMGAYTMADLTYAHRFLDNMITATIGIKNLFDVSNVTSTLGSGGAHSVSSSQYPVGIGRMGTFSVEVRL